MSRKIEWLAILIFNLIRLPFIWLLTLGKIKFSVVEIISPFADIAIGNFGSIKFGRKCVIDKGTLIRSSGGNIEIGESVYINRNCNIVSRKSIFLGNGVTIGPNVNIYDHDHIIGKNKINQAYCSESISIGENVWIGASVVILKGVSIGNDSIIGAGSIISKDIPSNTLAFSKNDIIKRSIC